ncbi:MAG TPA: biotin/lipoyl-containing protein, partial [Ktedonobacteraceae bacterium]|nr:biotin/lipoyl-containing protein [Ktedonobacteraceae bacterium]
MDGISYNRAASTSSSNESQDDTTANVMSIEQLQHLVRLLDNSDVSELELKRPGEGTHLVLRKATTPTGNELLVEHQYAPAADNIPAMLDPEKTEHKILAPLVGTFHTWAKPKGGALVAVGDRVKAGQLVGTIESLNVLNEVETTVAGHVVEIFVQDGQPVEYGQVLMTINS